VPYTEADFASIATAINGRSEMDALIAYLQGLKYLGSSEPQP
jgi:cbb3-type cytochrome oxidase cytochrome c subunit